MPWVRNLLARLIVYAHWPIIPSETMVFNDILTAKAAQHDLRKNYYDTILLSEQELLELKLKVNHASQAI